MNLIFKTLYILFFKEWFELFKNLGSSFVAVEEQGAYLAMEIMGWEKEVIHSFRPYVTQQ